MINCPGISRDKYNCLPIKSFDDMDSPLSVQQYIQQLIRQDPSQVALIIEADESQDPDVWVYEQLRQVCIELNGFVGGLCLICVECDEMKGENETFLCAPHDIPRSVNIKFNTNYNIVLCKKLHCSYIGSFNNAIIKHKALSKSVH